MGITSNETHRTRYLNALLANDRGAARQVVVEALACGTTAKSLLVEILGPAQHELGERWHSGSISIADEHWGTEVTREMMQLTRSHAPAAPPLGVSAVIASVAEEPHALAGRMFADLLTASGWHVDYLGAAIPKDALVSYLDRRQPDLLGISVTLEGLLDQVLDTCQEIRRLPKPPKILIGGAAAFAANPELRQIVDAIGTCAESGIEQAKKLVGLGERDFARYLKTVGRRIASLRQESGLSQSRLAQNANVTRPYLSAVEQGRQNISLEIALRIAGALQLPMERLLSEDSSR